MKLILEHETTDESYTITSYNDVKKLKNKIDLNVFWVNYDEMDITNEPIDCMLFDLLEVDSDTLEQFFDLCEESFENKLVLLFIQHNLGNIYFHYVRNIENIKKLVEYIELNTFEELALYLYGRGEYEFPDWTISGNLKIDMISVLAKHLTCENEWIPYYFGGVNYFYRVRY